MPPRCIKETKAAKTLREGGGFKVRRPVGHAIPSCDPFLMLDHMGPVTHGPGEAIGAPDHPHRGFETVTYLIDGEMCHKDSVGNSGTLGPGWVQWMTAGSGIIHSEMPTDNIMKHGGSTEGFQLWVNLKAKDKMIKPRYQDTPPKNIPVVYMDDKKVRVKVIAGTSLGAHAHIETRTPILYLDIHLEPGATFTQPVPETYNGFVYVWRGEGSLGSNEVCTKEGHVAVLGEGTEFTLKASLQQECNVLLIAGEPLNEPVVWQNGFVMNTEEEIRQAYADFRSGKLGGISGMEQRMKQTEQARATQKKNKTW